MEFGYQRTIGTDVDFRGYYGPQVDQELPIGLQALCLQRWYWGSSRSHTFRNFGRRRLLRWLQSSSGKDSDLYADRRESRDEALLREKSCLLLETGFARVVQFSY
jgi:hypothetical protein